MGARGPKKKPVEVKKRAGTYRKTRDGGILPVAYGLPVCPFGEESPEAKAWEQVVRVLRESGLDTILASADAGTLEAAAVAWCRARQASEVVSKLPPAKRYVQTKSNGLQPHPASREERASWAECRKYLSDLGMSPAARASLSVTAKSAGSTEADVNAFQKALMSARPEPVE